MTNTRNQSSSAIFEKSKTSSYFVHPTYISSKMADIRNCSVCSKVANLRKLVHNACFGRHTSHIVFVITIATLFGFASSAQIVSNDINTAMEMDSNQPIKLLWGISDTSAVVGKVFNFHIPKDTFEGNVKTYKVLESGKEILPKWIKFDESLQALRGVPSLEDKGHYNLEVIAFGGDRTPQAKDVFTVTVKDDVPHVSSSKPLKSMGKTSAKPVNCLSGDPVTMVTIVVDTDLDQLLPEDKFELVNKLTSHLNIASEMLKMAPVGNKAKFDSSALVAGPGDAKTSQFSGAFLSWLVGCGKVEPDHMPVLQQLETSSANGEMSNAIGHGIVGWHVTNSRLKPTVKRMRRQVHATATPGITMAPPSRLPAGTVTSTDGGMPVDPDMTRSVPSMVSPTFSEIQPTPSQPPHVTTTSTMEMPPKIIPGDEITPTKVVEMEATKEVTEDIVPVFSYTDKPEMTRSQVLEPSMSMPESDMTKKTEVLPTSSTEMTKDPTTGGESRPTEATRVPPTVTTTRTPEPPRRTPKPTMPPKVIPEGPYECPQDGNDRHPEVWEKIEDMIVNAGDLVRFKIPEKAFYDCEDGNTRNLVVDVVHNIDWLTFNAEKQLLIGLPMKEDMGKNYDLQAIVIDSKGAVAKQEFRIHVLVVEPSDSKVTHEFALTIDVDYDEFMSDPKNKIELSNKIARLYGDKNSKKMTITKIERGSVIFAWTNNTVPTGDCPVGDIVELMSKVFTKNMTLTEEAKKGMEPYTIDKVAAVPAGSCENVDFEEALRNYDDTAKSKATPPYDMVTPAGKPDDDDDDDTDASKEKETPEDDDDNILITTVVPAVIIIVILFIALIIACVLYRKKRKGKMDMQDHHTFVNKGIPVIFADELEDKPSDSAKPLIMEEEKPPNPPPGYRRTSSESPGSTPPRNHKDQVAADQDEDEMEENDVTSPLYRPPPPVTASSENKQPRPHVQPAYRNPPPYVPP